MANAAFAMADKLEQEAPPAQWGDFTYAGRDKRPKLTIGIDFPFTLGTPSFLRPIRVPVTWRNREDPADETAGEQVVGVGGGGGVSLRAEYGYLPFQNNWFMHTVSGSFGFRGFPTEEEERAGFEAIDKPGTDSPWALRYTAGTGVMSHTPFLRPFVNGLMEGLYLVSGEQFLREGEGSHQLQFGFEVGFEIDPLVSFGNPAAKALSNPLGIKVSKLGDNTNLSLRFAWQRLGGRDATNSLSLLSMQLNFDL